MDHRDHYPCRPIHVPIIDVLIIDDPIIHPPIIDDPKSSHCVHQLPLRLALLISITIPYGLFSSERNLIMSIFYHSILILCSSVSCHSNDLSIAIRR